jgi:hypothetical protein
MYVNAQAGLQNRTAIIIITRLISVSFQRVPLCSICHNKHFLWSIDVLNPKMYLLFFKKTKLILRNSGLGENKGENKIRNKKRGQVLIILISLTCQGNQQGGETRDSLCH